MSIENLLDPNDQKLLQAHDMPVSALAVSRGGHLIASGQQGTKRFKGYMAPVFIWDIESGNRIMSLRGMTIKANILVFSTDDKFICGCGKFIYVSKVIIS